MYAFHINTLALQAARAAYCQRPPQVRGYKLPEKLKRTNDDAALVGAFLLLRAVNNRNF